MPASVELAEVAAQTVIGLTSQSINKVNELTSSIFHTRGGRIGSGMGSVIEGVWGFCCIASVEIGPKAEFNKGDFPDRGYVEKQNRRSSHEQASSFQRRREVQHH